jgi:hypothetical protein
MLLGPGASLPGSLGPGWVEEISAARGDTLSTFGIGAQGDLTTGGAGGLATRVGFSAAPFSTKPFPDASTPGLTEGDVPDAGDFGLSAKPWSFAAGCKTVSATGEGVLSSA